MSVVNRVKKTSIGKLLKEARGFYRREARSSLPWRLTRDPYKILVSEVMLQQTQVERVIAFYKKFIKQFPTAHALAQAPLSKVLAAWQGLGYNRRAKYLREAAKILSKAKVLEEKSGGTPAERVSRTFSKETFAKLKLPGVGPYTAGAVAAFAFNKPEVFIETNIRTVFLYHCYDISYQTKVADKDLLPLVAEALAKSHIEPREFYWMLMDYGAHLKRHGVKLNARSKHYVKQSKFKGSARQLRGAILRELLAGPKDEGALIKNLRPRKREEIKRGLERLVGEGFLVRHGNSYQVA